MLGIMKREYVGEKCSNGERLNWKWVSHECECEVLEWFPSEFKRDV